MIDDEQDLFRVRRGCVGHIFILKEIGEKTPKKHRMYVDFIDLEKAYDMVNWKAIWQVRRIYDVVSKL